MLNQRSVPTILSEAINKEINALSDQIIIGNITEYAVYREAVGTVKGLQLAQSIVRRELKKIVQDEDDD
jgi:hypothetical protein